VEKKKDLNLIRKGGLGEERGVIDAKREGGFLEAAAGGTRNQEEEGGLL